MECTVCHEGELHEEVIDTWIKRGERWACVRLSALVCDECDKEVFDRAGAETLSRLADPDSGDMPNDWISSPLFDTTAPHRTIAVRPITPTSTGFVFGLMTQPIENKQPLIPVGGTAEYETA